MVLGVKCHCKWMILGVKRHCKWMILDVKRHCKWMILGVKRHCKWMILGVKRHCKWMRQPEEMNTGHMRYVKRIYLRVPLLRGQTLGVKSRFKG